MVARGKHVQPLLGAEKAFGQAFRAIREEKGISQEQVSLRAELDRTTVSLIERGLVSAISLMFSAGLDRPIAFILVDHDGIADVESLIYP